MEKDISTILITGAAGFIGSALAKKLLRKGENVVGIDNLNSYYDINLKESRLRDIEFANNNSEGSWKFIKMSLEDQKGISELFEKYSPEVVINLAAQAGVRYSIKNPYSYIQSNLVGFANILENCRNYSTKNFIFASSSSVYGANRELPYSEDQKVDHPLSLYAATKMSNELMAHSYSHLYGIPTTGLRFFTVYGPWGRPDMAPMIFTKAILEKTKIKIFNHGDMKRDFTFIDDITEGIFKCCYKPATIEKELSSSAPYRIFNIGNNRPIKLMQFIEILETKLSIKADKIFLDMQKGDVKETWADIDELQKWVNYSPSTSFEEGIAKFVDWYVSYFKI